MHPEFWRVIYRLLRYPFVAIVSALLIGVVGVGIWVAVNAVERIHSHSSDTSFFIVLIAGCCGIGHAIFLGVVDRFAEEESDAIYCRKVLTWIPAIFAITSIGVFVLMVLLMSRSSPIMSAREVLKVLLDMFWDSGKIFGILSILIFIPSSMSFVLVAIIRRHEVLARRRLIFTFGALTLFLTLWWLLGPPVWFLAGVLREPFVRLLYFASLSTAFTCPLVLSATRRLDERVDRRVEAALTTG